MPWRRAVRLRKDAAARGVQLATCFASVAFLGFVAGGLAVLGETYPGRFLGDAYSAGRALHAKLTHFDGPFQLDLWRPARTDARGVTVHESGRAWDGLTLYTSGHAQKAFLIDMEGRIVHAWDLPYSKVWDGTAAVRRPQTDTHVYIEKALLFPNGDLLAVYVAVGDTPWATASSRWTGTRTSSGSTWPTLTTTWTSPRMGGSTCSRRRSAPTRSRSSCR
jgi:hypothetical protein